MLKTLLVVYLGINILTWTLIIPWLIIYLKDKYEESKAESKTATTIIEPTTTDNIHYSEYISGEDFMKIFPDTYVSHTKQINEDKEIDTYRFYYQGRYLTKEEVIEKAHEVLRKNINY